MSTPPPLAASRRCAGCATELAESFLACPVCARLVHAERLKELAAQAEQEQAAGDLGAALRTWRAALELLPTASRQSVALAERIGELSERVPAAERMAPPPPAVPAAGAPGAGWSRARWLKSAGAAGVVLALVWKLKVPLAFVLSKGKLLLAGLGQSGTLLSMLASFGVYWTAWGWRFAGGLVAALYVHEMGHVVALKRLGIAASAPMFIPGLGAFVRMGQYPATVREDARVGLAGPLWGLGASAAALLVYVATGAAIWAAIARASAWLNLFNLLPIGPLDGGRGFRALARGQRFAVCALFAAAWGVTGDGLPLLLALVAGLRAFGAGTPARPDQRTLVEFAVLVLGLTAVSVLAGPAWPGR